MTKTVAVLASFTALLGWAKIQRVKRDSAAAEARAIEAKVKASAAEAAKAEAAKALEAADEKRMLRLDTNAKTLVAATTLAFTLMAALGLATDRLPMLLDSSSAKPYILCAVALALAASLCGLLAYIVQPGTRILKMKSWVLEAVLIGAGVLALTGSLIFSAWGATVSFTEDGRPTITDIAVSPEDDTAVTMTFTVTAVGVSQSTRLLGFGSWVRNSESEEQIPPIYESTMRPDDKGLVQQKVTLHLLRPARDQSLRLQFYRMSDASQMDMVRADIHRPPPGASCADQGDQRSAPACALIVVPAAQTSAP